jgi:hypothetical protein
MTVQDPAGIASSCAYDARGSGEMSLRDNAEEVTERLTAEIAARAASAGVLVFESRLTRPSYAPEIAQAMLRPAAGQRSEQATQPVVNAGSLDQ